VTLEKKTIVVHLRPMTREEMNLADIPENERPGPEDTDEDTYGPVVVDGDMIVIPEAILETILRSIPGFKDYTLDDA
jgi:hypothetical protein